MPRCLGLRRGLTACLHLPLDLQFLLAVLYNQFAVVTSRLSWRWAQKKRSSTRSSDTSSDTSPDTLPDSSDAQHGASESMVVLGIETLSDTDVSDELSYEVLAASEALQIRLHNVMGGHVLQIRNRGIGGCFLQLVAYHLCRCAMSAHNVCKAKISNLLMNLVCQSPSLTLLREKKRKYCAMKRCVTRSFEVYPGFPWSEPSNGISKATVALPSM